MNELTTLSAEDREHFAALPVLITFLIAGSDNHIDEKEREWAQKLIEFRSMRNESQIVAYYLDVEKAWEHNFQKYAAALVDYSDSSIRNHFLSGEITKANPILEKLPADLSEKLYTSFVSFADQVAKASGGFLGFGAVSADEQKWLSLPMLKNPVSQE